MKRSLLILMLFAVMFSSFAGFATAATGLDGKEIVRLTDGIEHELNNEGFATFVDTSKLPEDIAADFRRIGVASYGGGAPDISRYTWVDFMTANSVYDNKTGYRSGLPHPGTYYPLTILYDAEGLPLAYALGQIEYTGQASSGGSSSGSNGGAADIATVDHLEASEKEVVLGVGKSQKLKVYAVYTNGDEKEITTAKDVVIRSESSSVANVNKGAVTAGKKEGTTNLIVTYSGKKLTVAVKVITNPVVSIKASTKQTTLTVGDTKQIKLTGTFADGKTKDVTNLATWSTDDSEIADVDGGEIEAISEGTTTVTAHYNGLSADIEVIAEPEEEEEAAQYVSLVASNKNIKLLPGDEKTIRIFGFTEEGTKEEVTDEVIWQSSKSDIVDADAGILTANKPGKAVVYVSYGDTELAINVEVIKEKAVKAILSSPAKFEMKKSSEKQLYAEALYIDNVKVDITDRAVWTVKNNSIVEVDQGSVTALKKGKTIITVKYKGKFTNIEVTVK